MLTNFIFLLDDAELYFSTDEEEEEFEVDYSSDDGYITA